MNMSAKKRRHSSKESPYNAEVMAAITKELPRVLVKEGYLRAEEVKKTADLKSETSHSAHAPVHIPVTAPLEQKLNFTPRGDRRALWYTVFFFSLLIFGIWAFNTRTLITDIWGERSSQKLIDQSKNDLNSVLETIKQNDKIFQNKLESPSAPSGQAEDALKEAFKSLNQSPR